MVKASQILGLNARDQLYCAINSLSAKKFGFSKIRAKEFFKKQDIQVAELYGILKSQEDIRTFDWSAIVGGFAVKPSNGSAGKGVLVIKRYDKKQRVWIDVEGKEHTEQDLRLHASDIQDGQYSTWGSIADVIVEERIPIHPDLENYVQFGTPDVRVIVFNKIPVMAMVRLPTKESGGRANLDQGAIALGIDLGTGRTMYGVSGKKDIMKQFPGQQTPTTGIQIPFWNDVLRTAVRAANATGFTFMGADIFLHPEKGVMIAEVNAYPGLSIQLANRAGLRRRLQKVEDIEARNVSHAVKIGQSLFAEAYPMDVESEVERVVISPHEEIVVYDDDDHPHNGQCLVNTGREWSAIAFDAAQDLGLANSNDVLWNEYMEGGGKEAVVEVKYKIRETVHTTAMIVSKRLNSQRYIVHLGRRDLGNYLIRGER
ncbi:MAG: sugar-transfer associated ATP-grasp domain-containing protein [Patescibacteria group bacterium]|mgnify:FL=1